MTRVGVRLYIYTENGTQQQQLRDSGRQSRVERRDPGRSAGVWTHGKLELCTLSVSVYVLAKIATG